MSKKDETKKEAQQETQEDAKTVETPAEWGYMQDAEVAQQAPPAEVTKDVAKVNPRTVIGLKSQPLSTGHNTDDLQSWDKIEIELRLRTENRNGKDVGIPYEGYVVKILRSGIKGPDKTFQDINKQVDFRLSSRPNYHVYHVPTGSVEVGKTYKLGLWSESVGRGATEQHLDRILFVGNERATGAPKN